MKKNENDVARSSQKDFIDHHVWRNETMHIRTENVTSTNKHFLIEHLSIAPFFMESRRNITTPSFQLTKNFKNLSGSQKTAHAKHSRGRRELTHED